ncbi:phosphoserine aminotransferase apoenzyme [Paenibacillus sp. UNCCL117]|uniref:3-phosphoserine/phosphohydroxythreonine transaminase n=1 Tax=unclassified Paenibacillus TaxID=185978 RepID=UPI000886A177|nr:MULTISPECIES: 3-phosphoserine/phosphohydroxythreonine transaminase [unclassified Paenibacillus]SDC03356.1 phosphoserine aminotransferase apoenzyme [Paenibacillus sp. cl123]SFW37055.1 phosphoserine aminotransferase apoenzyme [Paenibacillus sp. UNCCL117]
MTKRAYNFNAGPAALPLEVLQKAQEQFVEYQGIGMSIMEISHRSSQYEQLNEETQSLLKELYAIPDGYKIMFLQGGASTQFAMIPMNLLKAGQTAYYVQTGAWATKAIKEAKLFGETAIAASSESDRYTRIPDLSQLKLGDDAAYLHITSNETIEGTQYAEYPDTGSVPLIGDMSSDILCRPVDVSKFAMIYAGAQKNLGPSGVTVVIARDELVRESPKHLATMLRYDTHAKANSLYNTPPVYSVYMMNLVLKWVRDNGGAAAMEKRNKEKTGLIYEAIDRSEGFYRGVVQPAYRSIMNITFRMENEELEKKFVKESEQNGFVGLKGHRDVGGLRASTYNAVPFEACQALAAFMSDFQQRNG